MFLWETWCLFQTTILTHWCESSEKSYLIRKVLLFRSKSLAQKTQVWCVKALRRKEKKERKKLGLWKPQPNIALLWPITRFPAVYHKHKQTARYTTQQFRDVNEAALPRPRNPAAFCLTARFVFQCSLRCMQATAVGTVVLQVAKRRFSDIEIKRHLSFWIRNMMFICTNAKYPKKTDQYGILKSM